MSIPPMLTIANAIPSRSAVALRWGRNVQYRLPTQFAAIANETEITFARRGPSP